MAAVKAYVQEDVIATYILHLHAAAWREGHERQLVLPLADLAIWLEGEPGLRHLLSFATCRPARWARSAHLHCEQRPPSLKPSCG